MRRSLMPSRSQCIFLRRRGEIANTIAARTTVRPSGCRRTEDDQDVSSFHPAFCFLDGGKTAAPRRRLQALQPNGRSLRPVHQGERTSVPLLRRSAAPAKAAEALEDRPDRIRWMDGGENPAGTLGQIV